MTDQAPHHEEAFHPFEIERPDPLLFRYYVLASLLTGPLTPFVLLPLWFRYMTLRYKFDDTGVSMRWGILFRNEVTLTYRRIQDIHLTRNLLQRWMGLAKISLQTASGNNQAEMTIEGVLEAEALRNFLYGQMRGAKNEPTEFAADQAGQAEAEIDQAAGNSKELRVTRALEDIRDALKILADRQQSESA